LIGTPSYLSFDKISHKVVFKLFCLILAICCSSKIVNCEMPNPKPLWYTEAHE
jgi:hypothetical protein